MVNIPGNFSESILVSEWLNRIQSLGLESPFELLNESTGGDFPLFFKFSIFDYVKLNQISYLKVEL